MGAANLMSRTASPSPTASANPLPNPDASPSPSPSPNTTTNTGTGTNATPLPNPTAATSSISTSTPTASQAPAPTSTASPFLSLTGAPAPLPASSSFSPGPLAAGLFLALLAAATLVMARRRRRTTRLIEILESASLGPKRALVVARLGDELLVLGSSEGGIALLSTRPAAGLLSESTQSGGAGRASLGGLPALGRDTAADGLRREICRAGACPPPQEQEPRAAEPGLPPQGAKGRVLDLLSRLKGRVRSSGAPRFDAVLTESLEDVELRRKLAAGLAAQAGHPSSRSVTGSIP